MDDKFVEDLKNRVDLVEVIRKYAVVKKTGKNFTCKSPFRNERTPSFSISPEKQAWYDFGVGEGGDVISFIEKIENCSFIEAIEQLSDIAGIEMPKSVKNHAGPSKETKDDIFTLHKKASEYFATELQKSKQALEYSKNRYISSSMIKDWQLGFGGTDKTGLTKFLLKEGFAESLISQSGVAFERSFGDKSMMDRFYERLMIPIREPRNGQIIAFSGREIQGNKKIAKYINSPENPVYHKSSTLFGLEKARSVIREKDAIILVEGNFDVVFAHDRGFCNTVATCGTALTEEHLRIIKRLTTNVYLAFDGDLAGKKATLKGVEMLLKIECNPYIIEIKGAKDFGEFLEKKENAIVLQKVVDSAPRAMDFFFERFALKYLDKGIEGETRFLDAFFYFLGLITRPIEIDDFLTKIAQRINRPKSIVEAEFKKFKGHKNRYKKEKFVEDKKVHFTRQEHFVGFLSSNWEVFAPKIEAKQEKVLGLLIEDAPLKILRKRIEEEDLTKEEEQKLLGWEMYGQNLYESTNLEFLKSEFKRFATHLQKEHIELERRNKAKEIRQKLGK